MRVKIHSPEKEWGPIRQASSPEGWPPARRAIFWMAFYILLIIASFEAGWILRDFQKDDTRERTLKLETKFTDHDGRIVILEGPRKH